MRHKKKRSRLNRDDSLRKATLKMMARDLFKHQSIRTTLVKAKAAGRTAEKLITLAKKDDMNARRRAFDALRDRGVVIRLFKEILPLFKNRTSGYTRIIRLGTRRGDGAEIVMLELTEKIKEEKKEKKLFRNKKAVPEGDSQAQAPKTKATPEVSQDVKEEKTVEDVKKDRAKKEDKKIEKKGFFRKFFRRKTNM